MRTTRFTFAAAALAVGAIALAGCAGGTPETTSTPTSGGATDASGELLATVDTMFGAIKIPEPADGELTVVALGWSDAEIALALGIVPVAVYDWQGFGAENKGVGPWATDLFGSVDPAIVSTADGVDFETISSLEPDLILNTRSGGDEAEFKRLSEIAPTVYAPTGTAAWGTRWDVQTQLVADALGLSSEGEALVDDVQSQIDDAAAEHPEFAGLTSTVGAKFGDAYAAYIAGDLRADLMEELGFVQSPAVLALDTNQGFYNAVSVENVGVLDADVSIMFPIGYTLDVLKADPLIASLPVVQDGRTVFLDPDSELSGAFSAASPLSIPIALDGLLPQLTAIVG